VALYLISGAASQDAFQLYIAKPRVLLESESPICGYISEMQNYIQIALKWRKNWPHYLMAIQHSGCFLSKLSKGGLSMSQKRGLNPIKSIQNSNTPTPGSMDCTTSRKVNSSHR
jgi:hypothetical protein